MESTHPPPIERLPKVLRQFLYLTMALAALCLVVMAVCKYALGYTFPYDSPFLTPRFHYHDYWMFTDRFHLFHSPEFFTGHAEFVFSYPAPMAVFYKLMFLITHESTRGYLWIMGLTFAGVAALFARALLKANVALVPVLTLVVPSLFLSGPIWFEMNRANLEFFVWIFVTLGAWLFFRDKGYGAAACFGIAGAMKLFPFVYLGLFIAKKQYRQLIFAVAVASVATVASLWLVCPDIPLAWHSLNVNADKFGRVYLYQRLWQEVGFDHSLFALIKMLWRHLPGPAVMSRVLSTYMAVAAIGGTILFFARIRFLPRANQLVCLTVASVLLPPSSSDYTLIHLYAPWASLVFVAIYAARAGVEVPGLNKAFVCLAVLLSSETEFFFRHERAEGMIKAVALMALWYLAMRYPFALPEKVAVQDESFSAPAFPSLA